MADFKGYLLCQYACNQKANGVVLCTDWWCLQKTHLYGIPQ